MQIDREVDYYAKQSRQLTTLITVLGTIVAVVMGIGAVFGALNTMYSTVAARSREVATLRARLRQRQHRRVLRGGSLCIALVGGLLGCLAVVPIRINDGYDRLADFLSPGVRVLRHAGPSPVGAVFALLMGLVGGVPPAVRAARARIAVALREL